MLAIGSESGRPPLDASSKIIAIASKYITTSGKWAGVTFWKTR